MIWGGARPASAPIVPASWGGPSPPQMLQEMYQQMQAKRKEDADQKNWKAAIPTVLLKQDWLEHKAPAMKREKGLLRAATPMLFKRDAVALEDFKKWLDGSGQGKAHSKDLIRGAGRAMGAFDVEGDTPMDDVRVLVGMYLKDQHMAFLESPLLHPKFNWTRTMLEGLGSYAIFWCFFLI